MNSTIIQDEKSYKTFSLELDAKEADTYFDNAAKTLSTQHPIKGFRPGQAPFEVVAKALPYNRVYEEVARTTLTEVMPSFFAKQKLEQLGEPSVEFKQLEKGKGITFHVSIALWPTVTLPSYKDIHVEQKTPEVSDQEVAQALDYLKRSRKTEQVDDAFAKSLGDFKDVDALKQSIREGVLLEKTNIAREKARGELLENVREKTAIDVAPFLIDREAQRIVDHEQEQLSESNMSMEDYLKHINKTQEEFIAHTKDMAKKRLENALVLHELAKQERLEVRPQEVEERINRILSRFTSPEEAQKQLDPSTLKQRIEQQLLEEKVFLELLDKQIITK